jgi:hypothetical protein
LGLAIDFAFAELAFSEPALGLPEGCERIDMLDDISQLIPFYNMWLLAELLEAYLLLLDRWAARPGGLCPGDRAPAGQRMRAPSPGDPLALAGAILVMAASAPCDRVGPSRWLREPSGWLRSQQAALRQPHPRPPHACSLPRRC